MFLSCQIHLVIYIVAYEELKIGLKYFCDSYNIVMCVTLSAHYLTGHSPTSYWKFCVVVIRWALSPLNFLMQGIEKLDVKKCLSNCCSCFVCEQCLPILIIFMCANYRFVLICISDKKGGMNRKHSAYALIRYLCSKQVQFIQI